MSVESMWRGWRSLGGLRVGVSGVIGENGQISGGSERHLGIVGASGASMIKSGGPIG